jgi:hypothetical protein
MGARIATTIRAAFNEIKSLVPPERLRKFLPGTVHAIPGFPKDMVRVFVLGPPRIATLGKSLVTVRAMTSSI